MPNPQRSFVRPLLAWHEANGRHQLPWREPDRSPFEILVAEILLQRTTAASVSGAYLPIIARYPSPEAVVAARPEAVERRIAPLGLTKRAGFIYRSSERLLARHSGEIPHRYEDLLGLHGVGTYTARSVLIHAFNEDIAAVDTNVRRLISRFFDVPSDTDALRHLASALAPVSAGASSSTPCWTSPPMSVPPARHSARRAGSGITAGTPGTMTDQARDER